MYNNKCSRLRIQQKESTEIIGYYDKVLPNVKNKKSIILLQFLS